MNDSALKPNVILRGGPPSLTDDARLRGVSDTTLILKVPNGNRYEHFAPSSETVSVHGRTLRVYVWVRCTYVAE